METASTEVADTQNVSGYATHFDAETRMTINYEVKKLK